MPDKSINIRGVEWQYVTGGRGEQTLLIFHGAVGGAETMRGLAHAFEDEYRTITPTVADVSTLTEVCDAASAILDREHVGRAVLFGGSFGGLLAQAFFHRRREQVQDLILLSTNAPNPAAGARSARSNAFMRLLPFPLLRALMRLNQSFEENLTKRTLLSRVALSVNFNRNERYAPEDSAGWPGRVLVVESDDDPTLPPEERRRLRETYPRAFVCTLPGAAHMTLPLRLEELVGLVKAFLKDDYSTPAEIFAECSTAEGHDHLPHGEVNP